MARKHLPILAGAAASALFLLPVIARGQDMTNSMTPQGGWALPVPPTGWGGLPPTNNRSMTGTDHDHGDHGDHHHQGPMIVSWPYGYYSSGYSAAGSQPIVINVEAPQQPAPQPSGPPPPIPGIDTHPTVEETPSGIEIVRGPGSS